MRVRDLLTSIAHVLYGILTAFAPTHLATLMAALYVIYELDQEWRISDEAYEELAEYMLGISIGLVIHFVVR